MQPLFRAVRTVLQLRDQSCTAARTLQTEPSKPKADSPSEILRLTDELARFAAEESARADQLAKKNAALVELVASLTASLKTCIDAGPVAADATNTLSLPEAGAFLRHDGLVQCHRTASRMQSRSLPTYLSCQLEGAAETRQYRTCALIDQFACAKLRTPALV